MVLRFLYIIVCTVIVATSITLVGLSSHYLVTTKYTECTALLRRTSTGFVVLGSFFALRLLLHITHAFIDNSFRFKSIRCLTGRNTEREYAQERLEEYNAEDFVGTSYCQKGLSKLMKNQAMDFISTLSYQGCFIFFIPWAILGIYTICNTLSSACWQDKLLKSQQADKEDHDVTHFTVLLTETVLATVGVALAFLFFVINRLECCDPQQDDFEMNFTDIEEGPHPTLADLSETTDTSYNSDDVSESLTATDSSVSLEAQSQPEE
jgi:hypothetical protein